MTFHYNTITKLLVLTAFGAISSAACADDTQKTNEKTDQVEHLVITGEAPDAPGIVITDPKKPRQPLPAHDGADYLKTIAGFAVTRKGGADGDAIFRGMAGSRLGILVDGENILGGCNYRMDAPTAYIYPELHDSLTVIKGPQSVAHGAGHSAATILFERKTPDFSQAGYELHASMLGASFGRNDQLIDATIGSSDGYFRFGGSNSASNNYQDGAGKDVHSEYQRYSSQLTAGWTPTKNTLIELTTARSDGDAAYADRGMDGTKFLRESYSFRAEQRDIAPWLSELTLHWFDNSVDHVMDDQELRTPGMMGYANLTRDTKGGRITALMPFAADWQLTAGVDTQSNQHASRSAPPSGVYSNWQQDAEIEQKGLFAELVYQLNDNGKIASGYRLDQWQATDLRPMVGNMMSMKPNPSYNQERDDNLHSVFARYEHQLTDKPLTAYVGAGSTERFPDYWEMIAKESQMTVSAFNVAPEHTKQIDTGLLFADEKRQWSASVFYNQIDDFILVDYRSMMKMLGFVRNIDASSYGAELTYSQRLGDSLKVDSSLAYTRGTNDTDNSALPQLAPLEARIGADYQQQDWSVGMLWRVVAAQDRYALNTGNIVGKDLGPSSGFGILSANAAWKILPSLQLSLGIDNLFDRQYAEFVSRAGSNGMGGAIPGFEQTTRVNEPGRTAWLKLSWSFEDKF